MPKIIDIERWRVEIEIAEKFRNENFGEYSSSRHTRNGENIDYFDTGISAYGVSTTNLKDDQVLATLNLVHSVVKNIVPSLYYQNPKVLVFPKKMETQDTAPVVQQTLNHFYKELDVEEINQRVIWDAYVVGHGFYKIGYATKFGADMVDDRPKPLNAMQKGLVALGLKKPPKKEEETHPEINYRIVSEKPYIEYISPFDFGRDPRAKGLDDAMYWYQKYERTVKYMKENKKYKHTDKLRGVDPLDAKLISSVGQSEIEDFKTVTLFEIHYRTDEGNYILVISKDSDEYREHYHEENPYEIDGWQCDELTFNKHGHSQFAVSDITKIKALQDRFTQTNDSILEQVDKFVPKLAYNGTEVTPEGLRNLRDGGIGALIDTTKNPNEVFRELSFTQLKADLKALNDEIINMVTIQTGLTKAQLLGISVGETATEATIAQSGQTLRLNDMTRAVSRFSRRQAFKLWQVIRQFVDLEELQLINGISGIDERTGNPKYTWLTVTPDQADHMRTGEYDFDIEVGSTQKPDLSMVRKQFENLFSILARTDVIMLMQQQGSKVDLSELLRMYLNLFPEAVKDIGRIIQKITPETGNLLQPQVDERGGTTAGSNFNAVERQAAEPAPTQPNMASRIGGSL